MCVYVDVRMNNKKAEDLIDPQLFYAYHRTNIQFICTSAYTHICISTSALRVRYMILRIVRA
jgi:hypothetical protein